MKQMSHLSIISLLLIVCAGASCTQQQSQSTARTATVEASMAAQTASQPDAHAVISPTQEARLEWMKKTEPLSDKGSAEEQFGTDIGE